MTTVEERLSRLEGSYRHLATKADLADLKGDFKLMAFHVEGLSKAIAQTIDRLDRLEVSRSQGRMGFSSGEGN